MVHVPHDPNPSYDCAGCEALGLHVEWPNGCQVAQDRLRLTYPNDNALLLYLVGQAAGMGRFTDLPPAKVKYRLTHWTGFFADSHYDLELPAQRVGRSRPGVDPGPRRMGSGLTSPRG